MVLVGERSIKYSVDIPALEHVGFQLRPIEGKVRSSRIAFLGQLLRKVI